MKVVLIDPPTSFEQIYGDDLKKLAISLVKVFANYDPKDLVVNLAPDIAALIEFEKEQQERLEKLHNKHKK